MDRRGPPPVGPGRPLTREEADRSLDLLVWLFPDPPTVRMMMMEAARTMSDFGDAGSAWNMVQAVLARCAED